mmetsp:Transcript_32707/g.76685  ORF Transcript_32707/g.76685 Transcript_32707/m.76685 type:complete len:201 (-) Transcript_32707:654-1256(-)
MTMIPHPCQSDSRCAMQPAESCHPQAPQSSSPAERRSLPPAARTTARSLPGAPQSDQDKQLRQPELLAWHLSRSPPSAQQRPSNLEEAKKMRQAGMPLADSCYIADRCRQRPEKVAWTLHCLQLSSPWWRPCCRSCRKRSQSECSAVLCQGAARGPSECRPRGRIEASLPMFHGLRCWGVLVIASAQMALSDSCHLSCSA